MSALESDFKKVIALLPNPSSADTPHTWTVNGERGYRHGDARCSKLRRAANIQQVGPSTPADEVKHRPCPECFLPSFIRRQPEARVLNSLLELQRDLGDAAHQVGNSARGLSDIAHTKWLLGRISGGLARLTDRPEATDHYAKPIKEMQARADQLSAANHAALVARSGELLHSVAINTILPDRYGADTHLADDLAWRTLQGGRGSWEMLEVFDEWAKLRRRRVTGSAEVLAKARATFRLTSLEQLNGVATGGPSAANDNLIDHVRGAWESHRDRATQSLIDRWDLALAEVLAKDTPTLAAIRSYEGDGLANQVIAVYQVYRNEETETVVLRAPEMVTNWLVTQGKEPAYRKEFANGNRVHTHTDASSGGVIETAAHLWDPTGNGPYAVFSQAMKAAEALMS